MKQILVAVLCMLMPMTVLASESGYKVSYDGGSIPDTKAGTAAKLYIEAKQVRLDKGDANLANVPVSAITEISYGQDVHRRIGAAIGLAVVSFGIGALMLLAKSKKHYIGLTWDNAGTKGGLALQADKSDYRGLLAGIEGITGKKAVDSDTLNVKN